jgi:hypothetical protein
MYFYSTVFKIAAESGGIDRASGVGVAEGGACLTASSQPARDQTLQTKFTMKIRKIPYAI